MSTRKQRKSPARTHNPKGAGSNPARPTHRNCPLRARFRGAQRDGANLQKRGGWQGKWQGASVGALVGLAMLLAAVPASADSGLERFRPIAEQTFPQALANCPGGIALITGGLLDPDHGGEAQIGNAAFALAETRLSNVRHRISRAARKAKRAQRGKVRRRARARYRHLKVREARLEQTVAQKSCAVHVREDWPQWSPAFTCKLVVHEYGHLAGLQHTDNPNVMNPNAGPETVPACRGLD